MSRLSYMTLKSQSRLGLITPTSHLVSVYSSISSRTQHSDGLGIASLIYIPDIAQC